MQTDCFEIKIWSVKNNYFCHNKHDLDDVIRKKGNSTHQLFLQDFE